MSDLYWNVYFLFVIHQPRHCQQSTGRALQYIRANAKQSQKSGRGNEKREMKEEERQECCEVGSCKNYWPTCVGATVLHNQPQLKSAYRALRLSSISSTTTLKHHLSPRPSAHVTSHRRGGRSGFTLKWNVRLFLIFGWSTSFLHCRLIVLYKTAFFLIFQIKTLYNYSTIPQSPIPKFWVWLCFSVHSFNQRCDGFYSD